MSSHEGLNSPKNGSINHKQVNQQFALERRQWDRTRTMALQEYTQVMYDRETEEQIRHLINAHTANIIEEQTTRLINAVHPGNPADKANRHPDDYDYRDEDFDDKFDPAPVLRTRAPLRSERREQAALDAAQRRNRPALSAREARQRHADAWREYRVCPPKWDMTPAEYRSTSVDCTTSPTAALAGMTGALSWLSLAGLGVAAAIPGGFAPDGATWTVNGVMGGVGGALMTFTHVPKRRARRRVAELDPRDAVVLTDPKAIEEIEALAYPLDYPSLDHPWLDNPDRVDRAQRLKQMFETAQRLAGESPAKPSTANTTETAAAEVAERRRRWTQALDRFEKVDDAWADLLTDPLAVLSHARLLDVKNEATAAFIEAHGHARDLIGSRGRETPDADLPPTATVRELETAVRALATAWADAQVRAKRAGYDWMPEADLKRARRATGLLAQAADEDIDWGLKVTYTEQALKLMRAIEVVPVPEPVLRELAAKVAPAIEARSQPILTETAAETAAESTAGQVAPR